MLMGFSYRKKGRKGEEEKKKESQSISIADVCGRRVLGPSLIHSASVVGNGGRDLGKGEKL